MSNRLAPRDVRAEAAAMEPLVQQTERFSELLAVSCGSLVSTWDAEKVRRALQWARYLLHVYRRFAGRGRVREALERRLPARGGPLGLRSFAALESGDARLALRLLRNRALAPAAARAHAPPEREGRLRVFGGGRAELRGPRVRTWGRGLYSAPGGAGGAAAADDAAAAAAAAAAPAPASLR